MSIEAYHADNGNFAEKGFREAVSVSNQKITFCGVVSHHQNALIERYIQDITKNGRTLLLHAKRLWPEAIGTILWPFAVKAIVDRRNHLKLDDNGWAPIHKFSRVHSNIEIKNWHTWGCPIFVLDSRAKWISFKMGSKGACWYISRTFSL